MKHTGFVNFRNDLIEKAGVLLGESRTPGDGTGHGYRTKRFTFPERGEDARHLSEDLRGSHHGDALPGDSGGANGHACTIRMQVCGGAHK